MKVLFVDDDPEIGELADRIIRMLGHDPVVVVDGTEALSLLRQYEDQFDVVITDVRMPGMDGLSLLQNITGASIRVPVAVVTGHGDMDTAITALRHNAFEFIPKPFGVEDIKGIIEKAASIRTGDHHGLEQWPYQSETIEISFKAARDVDKLAAARLFRHLQPVLRHHGILSRSFMTPVQEALANALRHGSPAPGALIRVSATYDGNSIVVSIEDSGPGFDHRKVVNAIANGGDGLLAAKGIFHIKSAMDEVEWNAAGNMITMKRQLPLPRQS